LLAAVGDVSKMSRTFTAAAQASQLFARSAVIQHALSVSRSCRARRSLHSRLGYAARARTIRSAGELRWHSIPRYMKGTATTPAAVASRPDPAP
jgi:hypothetical protein